MSSETNGQTGGNTSFKVGETSETTVRQEMNRWYALVKIVPNIVFMGSVIAVSISGCEVLTSAIQTTPDSKNMIIEEVNNATMSLNARVEALEKRIESLSQQKEELKILTRSVENLTKRFHCRCGCKRVCSFLTYLRLPSVKKCCCCD